MDILNFEQIDLHDEPRDDDERDEEKVAREAAELFGTDRGLIGLQMIHHLVEV